MRATFWRLLPALCALTACSPQASVLTDDERREVAREVGDAVTVLTAAMNAGDPDAVLAFYDRGADFVYLGCTAFVLGGEAFAAMVGPSYRANEGVTYQQEVVRLQVLGADAVVVNLRGGSSLAPHLFWTQAWRRTEEGWKVSVEHESWPGCSEPSGPHPGTGGMPAPSPGDEPEAPTG